MYEAVQAKTGLSADRHGMVGDRLIEDVQTPRAQGWQAIQVVRPGQRGPVAADHWSSLSPLLDIQSRVR